jgi:hypothetical protein
MTEKILKIDIIPAIFVGYREDGNVLLKCLQGEDTVDRAFEPILFKDIENPKYILLGVMTGGNMMGLNVCDGSEFEDLYHEKWNVLLK